MHRTHLFLLLVTVLCVGAAVEGVRVLELQKDGAMTNESWAQSTMTSPSSPSASVCIRFKVYFFRPLTHIFSLTSREETREINGGRSCLLHFISLESQSRYRYLLGTITASHTTTHERRSQHTLTATYKESSPGIPLGRWFSDAKLVLGQYSLEYLNGYSKDRSFSGQLTHAGVWGRTLTPQEVLQLANCGASPTGLVIPWDQEWILSQSSFINVDESEICGKKTKSIYIKLSAMPYHAALAACAGLGGNLPVPTSHDHAFELLQVMKTPPELFLFWVGATDQDEEGVYITEHTGKEIQWAEWGSNDPNGLQWQNCLVLDETLLHDYPCHVSREFICYLPSQREWTLRGPCEEDTANYKYSLLHPEMGYVVFRGYYQYEIREENNTWIWRNIITNTVMARLSFTESRWPTGRLNWTVEHDVCEKKGRQVLQLSSCSRNEFTCKDGSCIPRVQRCDQRPDCRDESDEQECLLVHRPGGYLHTLPPPSQQAGSPLPVTIKLRIISLSLSDKDSYLEVTYHLNFSWVDLRLSFRNLKSASRLNQVPVTDHNKLWTPTLTLVNVRGTERTRVDSEAVLTVHRRGLSLNDDLSTPEDMDVYLGAENHLSMDRKYTSNFLCDLDLQLYPFDTQRCYLYMEVLSAATDFVMLERNLSFVTYEGAKLLIEYTVVSVSLRTNNSDTMAKAEVEVKLQRRVGYPIISIYVPTVILLILAYLSLIFRRDNFEARVMSSLTVLLVLAALFTQTSTSLPKTSYFKMVDVWLLFCISLIFFVIVFHVIIDMATEGKLSKQNPRSTSRSTPPTTKVMPIDAEQDEERDTSVPSKTLRVSVIPSWVIPPATSDPADANKILSDRLFKQALIFIPCYFGIFNFIYWLYIFA
ncbi:hypothetical protein Pcinc_012343 [Petrolisthes cinctipes]|uniref:C-type lectin domain-containing protein n=1 Tax=Petrolisthes cinctipes TaxID=88211 RepID=A0AAE1G1C2_PETCI|nr:hypothetical protein Pcinc_012343 [Petrolisthes cinctipes]